MTTKQAITTELGKDKYLVLGLGLVLLTLYVYNPTSMLENLTMMVVGGFLTLTRANQRSSDK